MEVHSIKNAESFQCKGRCHCGRVQIAVNVPGQVSVRKCNCSICSKTGHIHLIVAREDFEVLQGREALTEYRFNTGTARHLFCRHCGIKPFYVPRSHPQGYSVNLNCLELAAEVQVAMEHFDGLHWRQNISGLLQGG